MPVTMLDQLRAQISARLQERTERVAEMDQLLALPAQENRDLNEEETPRFKELRDSIKVIDTAVDDMESRVEELDELDARNRDREALAKRLQPKETETGSQQVQVTRDEVTYRKEGGHSFFQDYYAVKYQMGDTRGAAERLQRHDNELRAGVHGAEFRDVGTAAFGALVVPQYLPEMYAENLKAGRITANLCTPHALPPEGMTMTIPRGTTPTAVSAQTAENDNVNETNYDDTDLVVSVRTYAGQQDISRQAIERGRGIDEIIYMDLAAAYAAVLDADVINGPGTNGRHTGIYGTTGVLTVTSTVSNSTTNFLSKLAQAVAQVNSTRFLPADTIIMHPRRWGWLTAPAGTTADLDRRPYVVPRENMPMNAMGVGEPAAYGFVGSIYGVQVYTDANIPTTVTTGSTGDAQDVVIVARRPDLHLWEEGAAPRQFRFEETLGGQLTVKLVIAGYSAFTAGHHPEGAVVVVGSSLDTPVF